MLKNERLLLAAVCCLMAAVPFLLVTFPPMVDLPQHTAQVRLFSEALGAPASPYQIQWTTPYSLIYAVLGGSWLLVGAEHAGRVGMLLVVVLSVALLHRLAARMKRPVAAAALASGLLYSHILYWGFCPFALGWPVFLAFLLLLQRQPRRGWREVLLFLAAWAALYFTHILWFLVALGWLGARHLLLGQDLRQTAHRGVGALPFVALGAVWFPTLTEQGFASQTLWDTSPLQRLAPAWLSDAALGGLRGIGEPVFFGLVCAWILLAWFLHRRQPSERGNPELLLVGVVFLLLALLLPDLQTKTIRFAQRWVPPALAALLLAAPALRLRERYASLVAVLALGAFLAWTSASWVTFDRREMTGLKAAVEALPPRPRVLGLSLLKESEVVRAFPFMQAFAYSQVRRGGELNFSFADFAPSLVVYRPRRVKPWTTGLEWFPQRATPADLKHFDFVLMNGTEPMHAALRQTGVQPVTPSGRWRLYRVPPEVHADALPRR